jgi:hypothetical protein
MSLLKKTEKNKIINDGYESDESQTSNLLTSEAPSEYETVQINKKKQLSEAQLNSLAKARAKRKEIADENKRVKEQLLAEKRKAREAKITRQVTRQVKKEINQQKREVRQKQEEEKLKQEIDEYDYTYYSEEEEAPPPPPPKNKRVKQLQYEEPPREQPPVVMSRVEYMRYLGF